MSKKWLLEVDEEQANIVSKALETYARLLYGQIRIVLEELPNVDYQVRDEIQRIIDQNVGDNHHRSKKSNISWDIMQVIRHKLSWDLVGKDPDKDERTIDMMQVSFDEPFNTSGHQLPKFNKL